MVAPLFLSYQGQIQELTDGEASELKHNRASTVSFLYAPDAFLENIEI